MQKSELYPQGWGTTVRIVSDGPNGSKSFEMGIPVSFYMTSNDEPSADHRTCTSQSQSRTEIAGFLALMSPETTKNIFDQIIFSGPFQAGKPLKGVWKLPGVEVNRPVSAGDDPFSRQRVTARVKVELTP